MFGNNASTIRYCNFDGRALFADCNLFVMFGLTKAIFNNWSLIFMSSSFAARIYVRG